MSETDMASAGEHSVEIRWIVECADEATDPAFTLIVALAAQAEPTGTWAEIIAASKDSH